MTFGLGQLGRRLIVEGTAIHQPGQMVAVAELAKLGNQGLALGLQLLGSLQAGLQRMHCGLQLADLVAALDRR